MSPEHRRCSPRSSGAIAADGTSHSKSTSEVIRQQTRDPGERILATEDAPAGERKRYWLWLDNAITGLWVALLLAIIAYALVEGEAVMAQLDRLDLVAAYSPVALTPVSSEQIRAYNAKATLVP